MPTARELIEQELSGTIFDASFMGGLSTKLAAAERVIDRLQQRVEELERELERSLTGETEFDRERYRDRLDRMVAAFISSPRTPAVSKGNHIYAEDYIEAAKNQLSAIDKEVDK